jgi:hypothetical protein
MKLVTGTSYYSFISACVLAVFTQFMVPESLAQDGAKDVTDLSNWNQAGDANWRMEDGDLVADSGSGFVVSPTSSTDLEIKLEFWADDDSNSGVFVRCPKADDISGSSCYEVNIYDEREDQSGASGAIVNIAPSSQKMETEGRWNTYHIRVQGTKIVVVLNGVETVNIDDGTYAEGYTALQFGTGGLKFRNVMIEEL